MERNQLLTIIGFVSIFVGLVMVIVSDKSFIKSTPSIFIAYVFSWLIFLLILFIFKKLDFNIKL